MSNLLMISSDCHAVTLPGLYNEFMPAKYHELRTPGGSSTPCHPTLKLVFTETGCSWILETLRVLEFKARDPIFKHFTKGLSLRPTEYFACNCFIGASFMPDHEGSDRHRIGIDKLMYGTDYPHLEGTWPNSMREMQHVLGDHPEDEIRALLGATAAKVFGFDTEKLGVIAATIGPRLSDIRGGA